LRNRTEIAKYAGAALLLAGLSGCAGEQAYREGMQLINQGQVTPGLDKLRQAAREAPDNPQYHMALLNQRTLAVSRLLASADAALASGSLVEAEQLYRQAAALDKDNDRARAGLLQLQRTQEHQQQVAEAQELYGRGELDKSEDLVKRVLLENPRHREAHALEKRIAALQLDESLVGPTLKALKQPVTLEFRDAPVKMVFDALAQSTNVNFILDKDIGSEQLVSVFVRQEPLDKALDTLLKSNALRKKVVDANTVVIFQHTEQKQKEYEELMIKTFYLANTSPKTAADLIRSILKAKDVFVDERLNMLVIRDTPERLRMAARLVAQQDMPEPEVVLEVAVAEVTRGRLLDIGAQLPTQFGVVTPAAPGVGVAAPLPTLNLLKQLNSTNITMTPPAVNLSEQVSDINILANPRIRVRNKEKAKIQIGERVPVITTTSMGLVGGAQMMETVQYIDAGIKLEVEPNIYREGDVSIRVGLEVSALGAATTTKNGSTVYRLSTRNASTLLRLKDGETQLLAGLVNEEDRKTINGLPFISELPLIGRLFSTHQDNRQKSEVILSITPRIVRNISLPEARVTQFWSGTDEQGAAGYADGSIIPAPMDMPPATAPVEPAMAPKENPAMGMNNGLSGPGSSNPFVTQ
jgi:general secretion pathway protein D